MSVQQINSQQLTPQNAEAILTLIRSVWPPSANSVAPGIADSIAAWQQMDTTHWVIFDPEDAQNVVAHAMIFRREIETSSGPLKVGALAAVCVHPAQRGRGWGADVVRAAFASLPRSETSVALFQTGVPAFYEKLGARRVFNRFYDGTRTDGDQANPFWDDFTMIYPAAFDWPQGDIDLCGGGY